MTTEPFMGVSSKQMSDAAVLIRHKAEGPKRLRNGVSVTAEQCEACASILRAAEPSIANGVVAERPGFIDAKRQEEGPDLLFVMGILPSTTYRIDPDGQATEVEA